MIEFNPGSEQVLSPSLKEEAALVIAVGASSCKAIARLNAEVGVERFFVDIESAAVFSSPHAFAALDRMTDPDEAQIKYAVSHALTELDLLLDEIRPYAILLVIDNFKVVDQIAGLEIARVLQQHGKLFIAIILSEFGRKGAVQASLPENEQIMALSSGHLVIDATRLDTLENKIAYIHQACQSILQSVDPYGMVNVAFDDVCTALRGQYSHMAYSVVKSMPFLAPDVLSGLVSGHLLTLPELRRTSAAFLLIDGAPGQIKRSDVRQIAQAILGEIPIQAYVIYAQSNSDRASGELGITLLTSY